MSLTLGVRVESSTLGGLDVLANYNRAIRPIGTRGARSHKHQAREKNTVGASVVGQRANCSALVSTQERSSTKAHCLVRETMGTH